MEIRTVNEHTKSVRTQASTSVKFEKDGLWGVKSSSGKIILEPKYDKIEICTDFIYAHYGTRHTFFYRDGGSRDCPDREDDFHFYENGMIGLKRSDGSVFLPAIYDEIIDWGEDCDVVYVRRGNEFHYFNHLHEEILTDVEDIPQDAYPLIPYNLGEDQERNVLLCVEPIEKGEGGRDCYAYGQWVRLSRIPRSSIRELFSHCKTVEMPTEAIDHFEDECTYIYSARVCTSKGEYPITSCIEKLKTLGCYDSSWIYLLKLSINGKTKINPYDLYNAIKHFEDLDGCTRYHIAIDCDESLVDDEVRVFQVHYFWDDMGEFLNDNFSQNLLPDGTVEEIKSELDRHTPLERRKMLDEAFWWITYSETRSWDETEHVLEFLKSEGCNDFTTLLIRNIPTNTYYLEEIAPSEWQFKKNIVTWSLANGGQLNHIKDGKTLYEELVEDLNHSKNIDNGEPEWIRSLQNIEKFATWLRIHGAFTAVEQRMRIEERLDGLSPKEVIELVETL